MPPRPPSHLSSNARLLQPLHRQSTHFFSSSSSYNADFTHAVIGAGAVGLAIARRLQLHSPESRTLLLERHSHPGTETSSRNSEVIHAGLYYGHGTKKTRLCISGREQMYNLCQKHDIKHMNCGKWIVAQNKEQLGELEKVHGFASSVGVPTRFISAEEAKRREPDVRAEAGALESTSTGIVDSHGYMRYLHASFEEVGGETAFKSSVSRIEPLGEKKDGSRGYRIFVNGEEDPSNAVVVDTLINSAGLAACHVSNMVLPPERHKKPYYAKGSYYSYGASWPKPKTLVYPAPMPGHGGLGTHLTLDMAGRVRFGPDIQWIDDPSDLSVNDSGFEQALDDIQTYLPGLKREEVALDYAGIRPKLSPTSSATSGKGFVDFHIEKEKSFVGFVNLLGIESPGLTSSLAIADEVYGLIYR